jgi:hypothetical protein
MLRGPLLRPLLFSKLGQRLGEVGKSSDQPPVVGSQTKEAPILVFVP